MIYGYARVSSAGQAIDGNSLEAQSELLKANGAQKIFSDVYTGTKLHSHGHGSSTGSSCLIPIPKRLPIPAAMISNVVFIISFLSFV